MRLLLYLFILIPLVNSARSIDRRDVVNILEHLDSELRRADTYLDMRTNRIDSLQGLLDNTDDRHLPKRLELMLSIGDQYSPYRVDTALEYYKSGFQQAKHAGLDSIAALFAMKRAQYLPLLLYIHEAENIIDSLKSVRLPDGLAGDFYDSQRQMSSYISGFYISDSIESRRYRLKESQARQFLLTTLKEKSPRQSFNLAEELLYKGDTEQARGIFLSLIDDLSVEDPLSARASHHLADIALCKNNDLEATYYLALSALSDVRSATLEVSSLQDLGQILYNHGYITRSHNYLSHALKNAVNCGVPLRVLQSSRLLPLIQDAHQKQLEQQQARIYLIITILAISVLILFGLIYVIHKKKSTQQLLSRRLEEANRTKDTYISKFLSLCSTYMEKMQFFTSMVERKISAGKESDLLKLARSGKLLEEQSQEFYQIFDEAFLSIYPNFVNDVNRLLRPDQRVTLKKGEKLNTDLRILALMRLGIDDTSRIAQMLNYSVFTIYTYRNKFKSRAIDRNNFERDIFSIPSIG